MSPFAPAATLARGARYLERHGVASPRENAEIILGHVLGLDRAGLYARREPLAPEEARAFGRALCLRCAGTPVQHLTGEQAFRHLMLEIRPDVFVPRPETEVVVDVALAAIAATASPLVIDVCTGTGAIALSVAAERPDARVLAVDRSPAAVTLARANAERLGIDLEVSEGDLFGPIPDALRGSVDLVVSNPPYIRPDEFASLPADVYADPIDALVGDRDLTERLVRGAHEALRPGGHLVLEIGEAQAAETLALLEGFTDAAVERDLAGRDRIVRAVRA